MTGPSEETQHDAGFTLIEMLVAMTLLALLSLTLFYSIRFGTEIWRVSERVAEDSNRIRAVQSDLSRAIGSAYPEVVANAQDGHVDFDGQSDRLSFLTPDRDLQGALDRVTLVLDDEDNFVMTRELELSPASEGHGDAPRTLLRGVRSIEFSYFGQRSEMAAADWGPRWNARSALPNLIRVQVAFKDSHARKWSELIVSTRVAADVNCTYDVLSKSCQGR